MGRGGLEPPTSRLSGVRSNHLSYRPSRFCKAKPTLPDRRFCIAKSAERARPRSQATTNEPAARMFHIVLKRYEDGLVRLMNVRFP